MIDKTVKKPFEGLITKILGSEYLSHGKPYVKKRLDVKHGDLPKLNERFCIISLECLKTIIFLNQKLFEAYSECDEFRIWFDSKLNDKDFLNLEDIGRVLTKFETELKEMLEIEDVG